jgi:hypothetical protein
MVRRRISPPFPYISSLNNIYLENNQNIQCIKHSKYRQDSETSNYCFYEATQLLCKMTSTEEKPTLLQFETPSSFMVCGPTNSGKAWFVKRMLENARLMFKEPCSYCTVTGVCGNPCSTTCNRTWNKFWAKQMIVMFKWCDPMHTNRSTSTLLAL